MINNLPNLIQKLKKISNLYAQTNITNCKKKLEI